jgi:hypothetical protein
MTRQLVAIPGRALPCRALPCRTGPCRTGPCRAGPRGPVVRLTANCALADSPGFGVASPLAPPGRTAATRPVIATNDAAARASRRCRTALDAMAVSPPGGLNRPPEPGYAGTQLLRPERRHVHLSNFPAVASKASLSYAAADTTMVHVGFPAGDPLPDDPLPDDASLNAVSSETTAMRVCAGVHSRPRAGARPPPRAGTGFLRRGLCSPKFPRSANSGRSKRIILSPWLGPPGRGQIGGRWMSRRASPARWRIRHEGGHACSL